MAEDDVERTEQPTPKRRSEARRQGQIALSQESFIFANLLAVTIALGLIGHQALQIGLGATRALWLPRADLDMEGAMELLSLAARATATLLIPVLAASALAEIAIGLLQTRGNLASKRLAPSLARLSPLSNAKRLFKQQAIAELPKSIAKILLVGGVIWMAIRSSLDDYLGLLYLPLVEIIRFQIGTILHAFLVGCAVLFLIAAADYAYQYWRTEKALRMTKTEIKEERKQSEGDPLIKSRMRSLQFERARTRMMRAVPTADVVITNPEHISIALRYERTRMAAPRVVARGAGWIALRIREIARQSGVPIVENRPLARALYRSVRAGDYVPEKLYRAVAEVLAYVYRLDPRKAQTWQ
jgi:flagellar biosynthesis protein FlhB